MCADDFEKIEERIISKKSKWWKTVTLFPASIGMRKYGVTEIGWAVKKNMDFKK